MKSLIFIVMASASASNFGSAPARCPAPGIVDQPHIGFLLPKILPRNKCTRRKCSRFQPKAVTSSDSLSTGFESQVLNQRCLRSNLSKRQQNRHEFGAMPIKIGSAQSPVDIVLHGLRIGRRLHIPTNYPTSPWASVFDNPALRVVLSKVHASVLSAILEPAKQHVLEFTMDQIACVRDEVSRSCDAGERHLAVLAGLFAQHFTGGAYTCHSTVSGRAAGFDFTLTQPVPHDRLLQPDADARHLAAQQLAELRVDIGPRAGSAPELAEASMLGYSLEFEAQRPNGWGVCRVVARSRARDELWRHTADALFGVAGSGAAAAGNPWLGTSPAAAHEVTLVVDSEDRAVELQRRLGRGLDFADAELRDAGAPVGAATRRLEPVEQLPTARAAAVGWLGTPMAVRVRTIEEHRAAALPSAALRDARRAARREKWAARLAADAPLFGFSRALLRWIFEPSISSAAAAQPVLAAPPSWDRIQVRVVG